MADQCPFCFQQIKRPHIGGGRVPYGFKRVDGELLFCEYKGPALVSMIQYHNMGYTYRQLAQWATDNSIAPPSAAPWSYGSMHRVVNRGRSLAHLIPLDYLT